MPAVEPRYAEALISAAENPFQAAKIGSALSDFCSSIETSPELRTFMMNPIIPAEAKKDAVKQILPENSPELAERFLCLLIDKNRLESLSGIIAEYEYRVAKNSGTIIIEVTTAQPLTQKERDEISETYRKKYGSSEAVINERVMPSLLGGIRVQIGDDRVDDTLYNRLRGLKSAIN